MNDRRKFPNIFVLTAFGVMSLLGMLSLSRTTANIRNGDVVRLVGIGMCFGGALVSFAAYFRDRRSS